MKQPLYVQTVMEPEDASLIRMSTESLYLPAMELGNAPRVQERVKSVILCAVYAMEAENAGAVAELENAQDAGAQVE